MAIEEYINELKVTREAINDLCENLASGFMAANLETNLIKTSKLEELMRRAYTLQLLIKAIHELNLVKLEEYK